MAEWWDGLTEKQRRFCEEYSQNGGNAFASAKAAGYKECARQSHNNTNNPKIQAALESLRQTKTDSAVATREQRQAFWTQTMLNAELGYSDRLRASELLGKSQADFVDRTQLEGKGGSQLEVRLYLPDNKRSEPGGDERP